MLFATAFIACILIIAIKVSGSIIIWALNTMDRLVYKALWKWKTTLLWCFYRKTCSNSWKMKAPCLTDIDRIFVILYLWTSVFNTAIRYAILYFDRVSFIHSLILKAHLTLVLFSCAKTAQHSPNCSHATWSSKWFVIELSQNCQNYLEIWLYITNLTQEQSGCDLLPLLCISWWESARFIIEVCRTVTRCPRGYPAPPVKLIKVHFKHLSKSLFKIFPSSYHSNYQQNKPTRKIK